MMSSKLSLGDKQLKPRVEDNSGSHGQPREHAPLTLKNLPQDIVEDHIVPAAKALGKGALASLGSTGKHLHAQVMRSTTVPLVVAIRRQLSLSQVPSLPADLAAQQAATEVRPAGGNLGESLYALRRLEELFALRGHKAWCPTASDGLTRPERWSAAQIETALQMVLDGPAMGRLDFSEGLSEALRDLKATIMQPLLRWKIEELDALEARIGHRNSIHFDAAIDAIVKNAEQQKQDFVFEGVGISTLPPIWLYSKHVLSLELNFPHGRGFSLPAEICQLDSLTKLHLNGARVDEAMSDALSRLECLESLTLSGCSELQLTARLSNLKNLDRLDLKSNSLRAVPSAVSKLVNLKSLNLSYNQIRSVGDTLDRLNKLEVLDLKNNGMTDFDIGADALGRLVKLDLFRNDLRTFPLQVLSCSRLEVLILRHNLIDEVPSALRALKRLEQLDLSDNEIKSLGDGIGECSALKKLDLRDNLIRNIPGTFRMLHNLQFLDISSSLENKIPNSLVELSALATLKINHEIAQEEIEAFEKKFRAAHNREAPEILQTKKRTLSAYFSMVGIVG